MTMVTTTPACSNGALHPLLLLQLGPLLGTMSQSVRASPFDRSSHSPPLASLQDPSSIRGIHAPESSESSCAFSSLPLSIWLPPEHPKPPEPSPLSPSSLGSPSSSPQALHFSSRALSSLPWPNLAGGFRSNLDRTEAPLALTSPVGAPVRGEHVPLPLGLRLAPRTRD